MKTKIAILGMVASCAIGSATVHSLHAQTPPMAYAIAEIVVSNQDAYNKEFLPHIRKAIADAGGKFLVAGGKTETFQGALPAARVVVVQWPTLNKAQEWWNSSATKDAFAVGEKYATFRNYAVEGVGQ